MPMLNSYETDQSSPSDRDELGDGSFVHFWIIWEKIDTN